MEHDRLLPYEREIAERVAIRARQFSCAVQPGGHDDKTFRAAMTNDIIVALARHDLARVAELALGAEMALAHRAERRRHE